MARMASLREATAAKPWRCSQGEDDDEDDDDFKRAGTFAGGRGAGPTLRGRKIGSGPDFDFMGAAHSNPGRVWQVSGKPGC